jgi:hypothetical protein
MNKPMNRNTNRALAIACLLLAFGSAPAPAQTTAFNYTGYLLDGASPANGSNDLQFVLYAVPSGGAPLASSISLTNQPVNSGVFVVSLDFGDVFDGSERWLEISARPGGSANPFTNTFPRQKISASPYAVYANNGMPPAGITAFGGATAPVGWILCDGRAVSRTTYARLFAAVGTTWGGGDGTTTFNVPDFRGMFLRGSGVNATRLKANGSSYNGGGIGSYSGDQLQGHKHSIDRGSGTTTFGSGGVNNGGIWDQPTTTPVSDGVNGTPRTGDETRPASYSVNYLIKY